MDTPTLVEDKGIFEGTRIWAMKYGYEEHERYLTCISQGSSRDWFHKSRVLQAVLQVTLETLGLPVSMHYKHYRLSVTSRSIW